MIYIYIDIYIYLCTLYLWIHMNISQLPRPRLWEFFKRLAVACLTVAGRKGLGIFRHRETSMLRCIAKGHSRSRGQPSWNLAKKRNRLNIFKHGFPMFSLTQWPNCGTNATFEVPKRRSNAARDGISGPLIARKPWNHHCRHCLFWYSKTRNTPSWKHST